MKLSANAKTGSGQQVWPKGVGMIYLAMSPWEGMWKNRQQLMSRFARNLPVLYVEPAVRFRKWRKSLVKSVRSEGGAGRPQLEMIGDNLHIFHAAPSLAVSGSRYLGKYTLNRWFRAVLSAGREAGIEQPILWLSQPAQGAVLDAGEHLLSIYHVVDEYSGYTGAASKRRKALIESEQILLDQVDLTIAVSPELVRAKAGPDRDVRLVENAVDLRQFEEARAMTDVPADLQVIPRPRLGYSGLIGKRLNLGLVRELARNRPDWSIVMIGVEDARECQNVLSELRKMSNVYFLGEKAPSAVASYLSGLDLGLLPYELNVETSHISPLKMYEYLAAGLPVVSTAIPAADRKKNIVTVAHNAQDFEKSCEIALNNNDDGVILTRLDDASRNTWDHRIVELTDIINQKIGDLS